MKRVIPAISDETYRSIVSEYNAGSSLCAIGRKWGFKDYEIKKWIKQGHAGPCKKFVHLTNEMVDEIILMYQSGQSKMAIGRAMSVDEGAILYHFKKRGILSRPSNFRARTIPEKECPVCGVIFRRRKQRCSRRCYFSVPKTAEVIAKISAAHTGKKKLSIRGSGHPNFGWKYASIPGYLENFSKGIKNRKKTYARVSKAEKEIARFMLDSGIEFDPQYRHIGISYQFDFYIPSLKLIIEYQGDYWHANPTRYKPGSYINVKGSKRVIVESIWEKDRKKKDVAESLGYAMAWIWESDFKNLGMSAVTKAMESRREAFDIGDRRP